MSKNEIVLIGGYPGSGKSSLVDQFPGYERLNRDTSGGSLSDIASELERRLRSSKKNFVLDNTYGTKAQRKEILDVGERQKVPVRILWLDTSIEDAQVNICTRMMQRYGKIFMPEEFSASKDPGVFSPAVLFSFRKRMETGEVTVPEQAEGFKSVEIVKFVRRFNPEYKNKAIILDYDGTLRKTRSGEKYPTEVGDIQVLPNREILKKYAEQGYRLCGASNQSGIDKGLLTEETAKACFQYTNRLLGLDIDFAFCPHQSNPISCYCRKPMPGLLVQFIEKHQLDREQTIFVGDMTSDKTCARRAGIKYVDEAEFFKS